MKMNPVQMPRFAALRLETDKPIPYLKQGKSKRYKGELRRELEATTTIFETWMDEHKAKIDKITEGRDIKARVFTKLDRWEQFKKGGSQYEVEKKFGDSLQYIGIKFYDVAPDGKETRLQIRWPGLNPDGPTDEKGFTDWAQKFVLNRKNLFNNLTKALKSGVENIGTSVPTYEDQD